MSTQVASVMPPPAARPAAGFKRRREVTTLDEDEWTSRIEAIIQRDYYPDLPKLQNKLEWLQASRQLLLFISHDTLQPLFVEHYQIRLTCLPACQHTGCCVRCSGLSWFRWLLQAVRSGDAMQIQQAQLNIAQRRAGIKTPVGATPAAFGTPGASLLRTAGLGTPVFGTPSMTPGF